MPRQETFLTLTNGEEVVEVLKTYDQAFAREVFLGMDEGARSRLAASLDLDAEFDAEEIPKPTDDSYEDFLWDAMVDSAREDGQTFSYFVVTRSQGQKTERLFVSPDWPTAESYVHQLGIPGAGVSSSN